MPLYIKNDAIADLVAQLAKLRGLTPGGGAGELDRVKASLPLRRRAAIGSISLSAAEGETGTHLIQSPSRMIRPIRSARQGFTTRCIIYRLFVVKRDGSAPMGRSNAVAAGIAGSTLRHARIWISYGSNMLGRFVYGLVRRYGVGCVSPAC